MKKLNPVLRASSVCVVAILASCGGQQGLIGQSPAARQMPTAAAGWPLTAMQEAMYSKHLDAVRCIHHGSTAKGEFKARGTASGKYPGSFTTHGTLTAVENGSQSTEWAFSEGFKITSGSQTISGTIRGSGHHAFEWSPCHDFRNANLRYSIGSIKNRAEVGVVYGAKEHFKAILLEP